jgi:hypothetical protein
LEATIYAINNGSKPLERFSVAWYVLGVNLQGKNKIHAMKKHQQQQQQQQQQQERKEKTEAWGWGCHFRQRALHVRHLMRMM